MELKVTSRLWGCSGRRGGWEMNVRVLVTTSKRRRRRREESRK
jgi:hypothetical protein